MKYKVTEIDVEKKFKCIVFIGGLNKTDRKGISGGGAEQYMYFNDCLYQNNLIFCCHFSTTFLIEVILLEK